MSQRFTKRFDSTKNFGVSKNTTNFRGGRRGFSRRPRNNNRRQVNQNGFDISRFVNKTINTENNSPVLDNLKHQSFDEFLISNPIKENIKNRGYIKPTPIQDQAIPPILEGRDLIGIANTGTGKTAAFLIPIINKIFTSRDDKALIIVPTRELALQINDELRSFSANLRIYSSVVIGGASMGRQIFEIRRNPHVVVATPGRLKDLINQKILSLDEFSIIVLDEVDLMVDIGFINEVKYFISLLPKNRQSLFFSATISYKIREILNTFVNNPVTISIKKQETSENVDQDIIKVTDKTKKIEQLHDILIQNGVDKVLVFNRTKRDVDQLNRELASRGFQVGSIHGNKTQGQRKRVLESFKRDEIKILLATDVASRGLDIDNVTHVINYDLPETYDDYVHRIGRTGRGDKKGKALTFIQ